MSEAEDYSDNMEEYETDEEEAERYRRDQEKRESQDCWDWYDDTPCDQDIL